MPPVVAGAVALGGAALAAGGLGAALAATGLTGFAAQFGASMLVSTAASALMNPNIPMRDRTVTVRAPVEPRRIIYGRARVGGTIVFVHSTGSGNKQLHLVIALAGHRVKTIGAVYFDGQLAINAAGIPQGRWANRVGFDSRRGAGDQTAFAGLVAAAPALWTPDHRLSGIACIYLRLSHSNSAFPNGIPSITLDIEGKDDILDPRIGQRVYSENAALCLADYLSLERYSIGAAIGAPDGTDEDALIEAANICDEAVPLAEGGSEPRYTCNGVIGLDAAPKTVIEGMLSAMAGTLAWPGGVFRIHAGAWRAPTVELGPGDIREGGIAVQTRISRRENFNAVRGQFVSPENDWQPDDFPAYASEVYLAEDGERVWKDIVLPFTISASMAQRLAKITLERARRQQSVRLPGKISACRATVGGTVALTYPRWGYAAKPFEVRGLTLDAQAGGVLPELALRETSPLVYDWTASEEQIYAAAPRTTLPSAFDVDRPGTPAITEELYVTRDGTGVKALARVTWEPSPTVAVARYEVQARRVETPDGTPTGDDWLTYASTEQTLAEIHDIEPGRWEIRVKAVTTLGVSSDWAQAARTILGLTAPPAQLQGLNIQVGGNIAVLRWQSAADLDVRVGGRILIRHSASETPSWSNSVSVAEVAGSDGSAVVTLIPGTYLLRARDNSGNLGPAAMIRTEAAQVLDYVPAGILQEDPSFGGARDGVELVDNTLRLTGAPSEGLYAFAAAMDLGSVRNLRLRSHVTVAGLALGLTVDDRGDPIDSWPDFDGTDDAEIDVRVEAQITRDDPAGPDPGWSDWFRLQSTEVAARGIRARARLVSASEDFNVIVSQLRVHADEVA
ncbi:phage tail protein [Halodurantibacterium flavum]|uniref:Phage tail protein n=1 Tax=Halodurantibacterium flavum TaxID=1382802 RepID=A0ABW4S8L2_9RHOB